VARRTRNLRGLSIVEALLASLVVAVAITAMVGGWTVSFRENQRATEAAQAGQIARAELERAKVFGVLNFPTGTYNSTTLTGSWTGAYDPTSGWVSSGTTYFNFNGVQVASSTASGVYFSEQLTTTDSTVLKGTGTTYTVSVASRRAIVVTIKRVSDNTVVLRMATNMVTGGL
jgi:Tfp pilus assembly protein PilV